MALLSSLARFLGTASRYPDLNGFTETLQHGPRHVWIEPTSRCNTRCRHCGHYSHSFGADMSLELFEKISDSVLDGVQSTDLIGYGEPLMAQHFDSFFDSCVERGIAISFTTNGILLRDEERLRRMVRHPVEIVLSIDGARKETYEFVRPYIRWEKTLEVLETLKRVREAAGSEDCCFLRFNFVPMKNNIGDLPDLVRLAHRYGAKKIFQLPLAGEDSNELKGQSLHDDPQLVVGPLTEAIQESCRYGIDLTIPTLFRQMLQRHASLRQRLKLTRAFGHRRGGRRLIQALAFGFGSRAKTGLTFCMFPWNDAYFGSEGSVYPCCILSGKLGDLNEEDWQKIWNGRKYRNLRRTVHSWNPTAGCRYCSLSPGINGGDERQYDKFFSKFQCENLPLADAAFDAGFHQMEFAPDGTASHIWLGRQGSFEIPVSKRAKFLRLIIIPMSTGVIPFNCGWMWVGAGGKREPFDNTCREIVLPLEVQHSSPRRRVFIEMEETFTAPPDPRPLGLALHKLEFLY